VFKSLGPAHIGLRLPWREAHDLAARHGFQGVELTTGILDAGVRAHPPEGRVAAVAASLESVWL
jgi:hypothetical protein